ncbi:MAG: hypothetical protein ACKOXO_07830 [Cyanobium sp.]
MSKSHLLALRHVAATLALGAGAAPHCLLRARPQRPSAPQTAPTWEEILGER